MNTVEAHVTCAAPACRLHALSEGYCKGVRSTIMSDDAECHLQHELEVGGVGRDARVQPEADVSRLHP